MTKTENYQLPQWEATDPVKREDFNEAFANLDAGLPYVVGTYTGNGSTKTVTVGFRPSFVLIDTDTDCSTPSSHYQMFGIFLGILSKDLSYSTVTLTDTGFQIVRSTDYYPHLNESSTKYIYIAFR